MRYHANATTNINQREAIKKSKENYRTLADRFQVSIGTVHTWKHRDSVTDKSTEPQTKQYALTEHERQLLVGFRQMEWHSYVGPRLVEKQVALFSFSKDDLFVQTAYHMKRFSNALDVFTDGLK